MTRRSAWNTPVATLVQREFEPLVEQAFESMQTGKMEPAQYRAVRKHAREIVSWVALMEMVNKLPEEEGEELRAKHLSIDYNFDRVGKK